MGAVRRVLAVDPGRAKCGVAVVDARAGVLHHEVVAQEQIEERVATLVRRHAPDVIVVGDRTGSVEVRRRLQALDVVRAAGGVRTVDEKNTSFEARRRYFQANPPKGLWRLVPVGLRVPPGPVDDWAAVVLAERFLKDAASTQGGI